MFPQVMMEEEKRNHETFMKEEYLTEGDQWEVLRNNSILYSKRARCGSVVDRYEIQAEQPTITSDIHVVRIGDIAFATNPFELFLNYGNQIRARSLASQTFLIQLSCGSCGYLPTEKAEMGSHYSAFVSSGTTGHVGGEILVRKTLKEINEMFKS